MFTSECHSCGDPMQSRKPSKSGASFCRKRACQNAKARFFRQRWKDGQTVERDGDVSRAFISAALHKPRQPCPICGLVDAVPPYIHRHAGDPTRPCPGVGGYGMKEGLPAFWVDVVHPDLAEKAKSA